jgi:hypothetical protein
MQQTLLPNSLEDYVSEENPVRVIEVFIDELDLAEIIELPGAKLWLPEEYPEFVSEKLRVHWTRVTLEAYASSITATGATSSGGAR